MEKNSGAEKSAIKMDDCVLQGYRNLSLSHAWLRTPTSTLVHFRLRPLTCMLSLNITENKKKRKEIIKIIVTTMIICRMDQTHTHTHTYRKGKQ